MHVYSEGLVFRGLQSPPWGDDESTAAGFSSRLFEN